MREEQLPKILIVDDRPDGQRVMEETLRSIPADLHFVSSGAEALGVIMSHEIAVVLMEVQMLGLDGFSTAIAMKSSCRSMRQTPIIFITDAGADESAEYKGYEAGAVDYLYKPVNPHVLRAKVEVFLNLYRLQREIRRKNDVLEERTAELMAACDAAQAASIAKGHFLANMSHELRTPMTAILGFSDILLRSLEKPENIDFATTVKVNGEYLLNLINDILDLSKIESGKLDVEQIAYSPHQIITDVVSLMSVRAKAKGLPLVVQFDGPVPEFIYTDPTRLSQILINIVGNAIKFTKTGLIKIVTRLLNETCGDPKLQFDVIDTGIGIPADKCEEVFNPFTQADSTTTRKFGGTGLGLSISKRLVELLGGEFSVSSTVGEGSTFSITVSTGPLDDVRLIRDTSEACAETTDGKVVDVRDIPLCNRRILLTEDGPDNQRLIGFVLKKAGAKVTLADNGLIGWELATAAKAEGRPFDVILMDMQMPILDGYSATRRLRNDGYSSPIIALTAHAMSGDRQKCLDAGCDNFATKPIDREKLIELVASYAKRSEVVEATLTTN
ncbi:MAG: hybrid sensor histidine kinase/response regulator [Blastopirellula sp.]|nr:MAG: hybrid sensor histidine kinase/response regulator [Blastopirellula sp.]